MTVVFKKEKFSDICEELPPLLVAHHHEVSRAEAAPLDFNFKKYIALENLGMYHVLTARDEGNLIGYGLCLLNESLHDQKIWGYCNLYLTDGHKSPWLFIKLARAVDDMVKSLGAAGNHMGTHPKKDISTLYERLGYTLEEMIYFKPY